MPILAVALLQRHARDPIPHQPTLLARLGEPAEVTTSYSLPDGTTAISFALESTAHLNDDALRLVLGGNRG